LSGRGLCDELITRPEESYRLCCVVECDLETSRMGAPYIYDISHLRVNSVWTGTFNIRRDTKVLNKFMHEIVLPVKRIGYMRVEGTNFHKRYHDKAMLICSVVALGLPNDYVCWIYMSLALPTVETSTHL